MARSFQKQQTFPAAPGQRAWHILWVSSAERRTGKELEYGLSRVLQSNPRAGLSTLPNY